MLLKPKNWEVFQHYKDRCPPWIKLHRDLLNDRDFMRLPLASKAIAPLLWLLASEHKDGHFDACFEELSFRLRISREEYDSGLKPLISNGFFVDASTMLAPCLQDAIPETERETEVETETERDLEAKASRPRASARTPSAPVDKLVEMYNRLLPMLPRAEVISAARRRAISARWREVVTTDKMGQEEALEWFEWFFKRVSTSKFLTGRLKDWKADIDFLFNANKFGRIVEGAYHKE